MLAETCKRIQQLARMVAFLLTLFVCEINDINVSPYSTRSSGVYRLFIAEVGDSFNSHQRDFRSVKFWKSDVMVLQLRHSKEFRLLFPRSDCVYLKI